MTIRSAATSDARPAPDRSSEALRLVAKGAMGGGIFETNDTRRNTFQKQEETNNGRNPEADA